MIYGYQNVQKTKKKEIFFFIMINKIYDKQFYYAPPIDRSSAQSAVKADLNFITPK